MTYSITFLGGDDSKGTAPSIANKEAGATFELPQNTFTKTDYSFVGWFDGSTVVEAGKTYTMPANNITFTARWVSSIPTTFTITFNSMGGSDVAPISDVAGQTITAPANPTKDGYEFDGWYTSNDNGTTLSATPFTISIMGNTNITLYAKWVKPIVGNWITYQVIMTSGTNSTTYNIGDNVEGMPIGTNFSTLNVNDDNTFSITTIEGNNTGSWTYNSETNLYWFATGHLIEGVELKLYGTLLNGKLTVVMGEKNIGEANYSKTEVVYNK